VILVKFIDVRHLLQRGRSTGESKTSVSDKGMLPTLSSHDLSARSFPQKTMGAKVSLDKLSGLSGGRL
jgi:hypothetical protein